MTMGSLAMRYPTFSLENNKVQFKVLCEQMDSEDKQQIASSLLACRRQLYRYFAVRSTTLPALVTQLYSRLVAEAYVEPWEELTRRVVKVCNNFEKMKDDAAEFAKEAAGDEKDEEEDGEKDWEEEEDEEDEEEEEEVQEETLTLKRKRRQDPSIPSPEQSASMFIFYLEN